MFFCSIYLCSKRHPGYTMSQRFKSAPCIGFCSTTYGDAVCRGCYRSLHEVLHWAHLSTEEKQSFYDRIGFLAEKQLNKLLDITHPELLEQWLQDLPVYCQDPQKRSLAYDLLQALQQGVNVITESRGACRTQGNLHIRDIYRSVDQSVYKERCQEVARNSSSEQKKPVPQSDVG